MTVHTAHFRHHRLSLLAAAVMMTVNAPSLAQSLAANTLPTGWAVTSGSATFTQNGTTLNINQTSQQAIANFATFSVGSGATVNLQQLNSSAAMLARVTGSDPSLIQGQIKADGALWLINQAGIMVGPGARIDVARFIASSLNVSDSDFLANKLNFKSVGTPGEVRNAGTINAASGGSIYLVASSVTNTGSLNAPGGEVLLAAGQTVSLVDTATPGVSVAITGTAGEVKNIGQITAEAGRIGLAAGLISNSGSINASSAVREGGRIFLRASGDIRTSATSNISANGTTGGNVVLVAEKAALLDGDISATGSAGRGGYVDTSGKTSLDVVKAPVVGSGGEWHIDPLNVEIIAGGPDAGVVTEGSVITSNDTGAHIAASTITAQLNAGANVTISTGADSADLGNITVSSAIAKTGGTDASLTLNAHNNIIINAAITSASGKLNLNLRSNATNITPLANHDAQLNASVALNGGNLTVSTEDGNGNGTLNIAGGTTALTAGSAINAAAVNVLAGGALAGSGTLELGGTGTLTNNGTVSPGTAASTGRLRVRGNYTQGATGVLNIKLAGSDAFDVLAADTTTTLNGRLNVRTLNDFVPATGASFNFLQAPGPGNTGSFSTVDAPNVGPIGSQKVLSVTYPNAANTVSRITAALAPIPPAPPPSADICTIAPNSALCQVLSPPTASEPVKPVQQATNEIIKTVTSSAPKMFSPGGPLSASAATEYITDLPVSIPATGSGGSSASGDSGTTAGGGSSTTGASSGGASPDDKKADGKSDSKETVVASNEKSGLKNEPAKKMFCN